MESIFDLLGNKCVFIPVGTWFFIQVFKFLFDSIKTKKIQLKRILGAGGMPSSHSAVVCSLAILVGKTAGFNSQVFAVALILAIIVMYDAAGVRRAAGNQAKVINRMIAEDDDFSALQGQDKLNEILGHTPTQVFVGAIIGIIVGLIF